MISKHPALLLTRPIESAREFASRLNLAPTVEVVFSPLIEIAYLEHNVSFDAAVFSSQNGVISAGSGHGRPAFCVGENTASCARRAGFFVKETGTTASDLIDKMAGDTSKERLIHLRGEFSRGDIAKNLSALGIECGEEIVYRQKALPLSNQAQNLLARTKTVVVPLFSPRTAQLFLEQWRSLKVLPIRTQNLTVVALSESVADPLPKPLFENTIVPQQPTGDMMLQIVARFFCD